MPIFRNYQDILAHFNKNPISSEQILKSKGYAVDIEHFKYIMEREAKLLAECIQEALDDYYAGYIPKVYRRREERGFANSLRRGIEVTPTTVSNARGKTKISIGIRFNDNHAMHPSLFNGEPGFVPNLLNYGWKWRKRSGPYRLAYYEGAKFVEKGISKYYSKSYTRLGIKIEVRYRGRLIVNKEFSPEI